MIKGFYFLEGQEGLWAVISIEEYDHIIYVLFQNIGSGRFVEVAIDPFEWIAEKNLFHQYVV
jgi:hypothetical protein